jgi:hypothetical protein
VALRQSHCGTQNELPFPDSAGDGLEAPMDEHAEARGTPPLHVGIALSLGLGVLDGRHRMQPRLLRRKGGGVQAADDKTDEQQKIFGAEKPQSDHRRYLCQKVQSQ